MSHEKQCPQCGADLPADAPQELCPKCLMKMGLPTGAQIDKDDTQAAESSAASQTPPVFVPPQPAELAEQFPQLEILQLLGQGGMGAVYKATQTALDRPVALKILPPHIGQDPAFAERFTREARAMAKLNHPHIVSVYDFGNTTEGLYYFVMEFVDGADLRHVIRSREISPKEALAIVPQICDALQYAHEEGIVHRDIKPENVLLDKKGRVKIADFGLAKLLDRPPTPYTLTDPAQRMGTPHYMAPEQIEHPHDVDHRADIYSLGVVFYEMLTGELPLGRFPPPSRKVHIDVRLDEVVLKTLEKEPERRYQQASQVKTDVETISSSPKSAGAAADGVEAVRHRVWIPAVGLLAAAIINCLVIVGALIKLGGSVAAVLPVLYSLAVLLGGWNLMQLRSLRWAAIGSALATLPISPGALIGLPMGIWALILLTKKDVKAAFGQNQTDVSIPPKIREFTVSTVAHVKTAFDHEKAEFEKLARGKHLDQQDPAADSATTGMTMAIASCVLGLLSILFVSMNAQFPIRFAFGFASLAIAILTGIVAIKSIKSFREQIFQTCLAAAGIFFAAVAALTLLRNVNMPW
ncbi:MAG TPA: serine/threonine-protein kinase [Sedimentisphaerales bacterium]|nr:serine/threonine-protein kinase [Sedimentisphaerales bacterium]